MPVQGMQIIKIFKNFSASNMPFFLTGQAASTTLCLVKTIGALLVAILLLPPSMIHERYIDLNNALKPVSVDGVSRLFFAKASGINMRAGS